MTPGKKYTIYTGILYLLLGGLIALGMLFSPGGPCTPGWGAMLFLFIPILAGAGLLLSAGLRLYGRRAWTGPLIIHGMVLVIWYFVAGF
jgi:hypothetical protein